MSDDSKKELTGSTFVTRLTKQTGLPFEKYGPVQVAANPSDHVASWRGLLGQVNRVYRQAIDEKVNVPSIWQQLEKQLAKSPVASVAQKVLAGRTHLNVVVPIESKQADLLYGKDLHVSISRIESFYHCQYQYFANYGLRLKERELYQLSPAAAGDFFHEALDQFFKLISNQGIDLVTLTGTQRLALAEEVLAAVFKEPRFGILTSSARMKYIAYQLSQTIQRVVWGLNEQAKRTGFTPQQTEVLFGQIGAEKGIDGLELDLKDHRKLFVRGKIDRLDKYEKDGQLWLSVVDYKSSDHSFNIAEAYYGLALQLTTYLDVALQDAVAKIGDVVHGAGAYYLHVHNPTFKPIDNLETQPVKEYQFDGFFVNDSSVFSAFDHSLSEKESSIVFPIKKDVKGNLTKVDRTGNKFYTEAEMAVLRQHNRKLMVSAGNELLTGQVALNPSYQGKEKRACTYCQFRSVCQFDVLLKENNYHRLDTLSKKEVFEKLTPQENDEAGDQK
jgi:ATP-dependent helicase/nuclease subunit B